jgi:hypothetical protein
LEATGAAVAPLLMNNLGDRYCKFTGRSAGIFCSMIVPEIASTKRRAGRQAKPVVRKRHCAIHTRKSSEEGLELGFNSLHSQREAFIASLRSAVWALVRDQNDDGGISGGRWNARGQVLD